MIVLASAAALCASLAWAFGYVLAQVPATRLGAFEFTRIQLLTSGVALVVFVTVLDGWRSVDWSQWPVLVIINGISIVVANLALAECLRRAGARRTQLVMTLQTPFVAVLAFIWFGERLPWTGLVGVGLILVGLALAIGGRVSSVGDTRLVGREIVCVLGLGVVAMGVNAASMLALKPVIVAGTDPLAANAIRCMSAGLFMALIGLWPSHRFAPREPLTPSLLRQAVVPGLLGYGVAVSLFLFALANLDAAVCMALGSLAPVFVLPILWMRFGLPPMPRAWAGALTAVAGVVVVTGA